MSCFKRVSEFFIARLIFSHFYFSFSVLPLILQCLPWASLTDPWKTVCLGGAILWAWEREPRAESLFLGALKDSRQNIQKWAQRPSMVITTCGVYYLSKMKSNESGLTKSDWTLTSFFSFSKFRTWVRRSMAIMNGFVKNGTVGKVWLTNWK